jgi:hypothetical protein
MNSETFDHLIESNDTDAILERFDTNVVTHFRQLVANQKYSILQTIFEKYREVELHDHRVVERIGRLCIEVIFSFDPAILKLFLESGLKFDASINPYLQYIVEYGKIMKYPCTYYHDLRYQRSGTVAEDISTLLFNIFAIFDLLLEYEYEFNKDGYCPLLQCREVEIFQYWINHGLNVMPYQYELLFDCARQGNYNLAEYLLRMGANPNLLSETNSAIIRASSNADYRMIKLFSKYGCDFRQHNNMIIQKFGTNYSLGDQIHDTSSSNINSDELIDLIKLFIDAGCNLKEHGHQLLRFSIKNKFWKAIDFLLNNGIDIQQLEKSISNERETDSCHLVKVFMAHGSSLEMAMKLLEF